MSNGDIEKTESPLSTEELNKSFALGIKEFLAGLTSDEADPVIEAGYDLSEDEGASEIKIGKTFYKPAIESERDGEGYQLGIFRQGGPELIYVFFMDGRAQKITVGFSELPGSASPSTDVSSQIEPNEYNRIGYTLDLASQYEERSRPLDISILWKIKRTYITQQSEIDI
ncbi:hypothetical protein KKE78_05560 [Patescibacteria group bacterium]|nr:hypothetical protein [Patescibacteria group bacterium]